MKSPPKRYYLPEPTTELTDKIIIQQIEPGSRVIDLGCGDGRLLDRLRKESQCDVLGVELDLNQLLCTVNRGVPVIQGDLDQGLPRIPTGSFDYAVLSETLQEVRHPKELLSEMMRVAKRSLIMVPNFAHWRVRLEIVWKGRAPVTNSLPYDWFNTPNQRFMSLHDFRDLALKLDCLILRELPIIQGRAVEKAWGANLRADHVLYVLEHCGS